MLIAFFVYIGVLSLLIIDPIYHHKRVVNLTGSLLLLLLGFCVYATYQYNSDSYIMTFIPFTALTSCFLAQFLYSRRVYFLYGFYPRILYRGHIRNGLFYKYPNNDLAKNYPDWIFTVYAFGGAFFGAVIPLAIDIGLMVWAN